MIKCTKCDNKELEVETISTDVDSDKLAIVSQVYCNKCDHEFTRISHYALKHIKDEIIDY